MQIVPTKDPRAKREGDTITVELQEDVSLSLSLDQAIMLYTGVQKQTCDLLNDAKARKANTAQVIAFPAHATRREAS